MTVGVFTRFLGLIVFELIGTVLSAQSLQLCPPFCVCDIWYELQRASCTGRHLYSIHIGAASNVKALDLSNNSISTLSNFELADAGLGQLKYLNLSGNSINEIGLYAFKDLPDLTVLDLSRNHLNYILHDVFAESKSLRILKLSKNNLNSHVPKLQSPWLMELSMDSCQISYLSTDTFHGLPRLRNLDLSNNVMIQLDSLVVQTLRFLKKLSLEGNPWSCNKMMYDLEVHLRLRNVQFNAVCSKSSSPKKFEKMILQPIAKFQNHLQPVFTNNNVTGGRVSVKNNISSVSSEGDTTTCLPTTTNEGDSKRSVDDTSAYWFLMLGFILGFASSMVISYIWLAGVFSCCRKPERHQRANDDPQRLSLLTHLWQFEDLLLSDNTSSTVSCPGTPPPPYREVLLRPSLYPRPPSGSNLNDNNSGYRER